MFLVVRELWVREVKNSCLCCYGPCGCLHSQTQSFTLTHVHTFWISGTHTLHRQPRWHRQCVGTSEKFSIWRPNSALTKLWTSQTELQNTPVCKIVEKDYHCLCYWLKQRQISQVFAADTSGPRLSSTYPKCVYVCVRVGDCKLDANVKTKLLVATE